MNIAGRMGRWSGAHWKTATFGWLAFVAVALVLGQMVGSRPLTNAEQAQDGSARAETILARAGFEPPATEAVLVQSSVARPADPAFGRNQDVIGHWRSKSLLMMTRMIWLVPSRIEWTLRSRQKRSTG